MAYDTTLEDRIDEVIASWGLDVPKRKMFGGLGYFINRNMAFGIKTDQLIIKADESTVQKLLQEPNIGYFDYGGKQMKSWLQAEAEALDEDNLVRYLEISRDYVLTLPPK
ncbi:TfoX/Sxy family protein [Candidatus Saccharibacteria bacterium]|nr:TfoX/Sxy family protein [Candidatus Saccharibacteria bacterium]